MKRTRRKNIFRNINGSRNRFLSILFIVALGSGFMAGLAATSPDMYETADRYMKEENTFDINVKSSLLFSDADADAFLALPEVEALQKTNVLDLILNTEAEENYTARVYSFLDENGESSMNRFVLKEGRLPETEKECVVQISLGRYFDGHLSLGDKLFISEDNELSEAFFQEQKSDHALQSDLSAENSKNKQNYLEIVGFVESPMCISITAEPTTAGTGRIQLDVYTKENFLKPKIAKVPGMHQTALGSGNEPCFYTDFYLKIAGTEDLNTFSDAYHETLSEAKEKIEALLSERISLRKKDVSDYYMLAGQIIPADSIPCSSLIRTREDSSGFQSFDGNVGKVAALSKIFPVFFFIVALLVALTTMTRLVEENRTQIGTLKALGFSNGQILSEYLFYSLSSSVIGCVLGFLIGFQLFPTAISSAYGMMYQLPKTVTPFRWNIAATVAPITIGSIFLATLFACYEEFRACPAVLIRPKAPAAGKRILLERIGFLWKKLSFTHKVSCRNLFRYKKRFFMTILGVAGCSALLLTGFGLRDSINDIVDKQFGDIYRYDLNVMLAKVNTAEISEGLNTILSDTKRISKYAFYGEESGTVLFHEKDDAVSLSVPADSKEFTEFVSLRNRKTGKEISFPAEGVVLTEKLCEQLRINTGDEVTLENKNGIRGTAVVTGITENYLTSYAYLTAETYEKVFHEKPEMNMVLCAIAKSADSGENKHPSSESLTDLKVETQDSVISALMSQENVAYVKSSQNLRDSFQDSIKSINGVILVLILAAGLLCIVVLYNLTNVNICERRKELATIRVLGFHKNETERYIFRETNVLSFLGSLAGLLVGIWLHSYVVKTVEIDQVMFGRNIYPLSYVYALAISMVFTLLVNIIMKRTLRKIDMVEAMKANE